MLFREMLLDECGYAAAFGEHRAILTGKSGGVAAKTGPSERKSIAFPHIDGHSPKNRRFLTGFERI